MNAHCAPTRPVSWGEAMDVPAVLEALGRQPGEALVLLRLFLLAADEVTGEPQHVSTFVKTLAMPPAMVGPDVSVALDILGERRVFKPSGVVWDEAHRVCILEITWVVADHGSMLGAWQPGEAWPA
jgi:hypothetical protein